MGTHRCLLYGVCRCIDLKVELIYAVSAVLSQIIEPTINPETRFWFGRLGYTLLEFKKMYYCFYYYYYYYYYY